MIIVVVTLVALTMANILALGYRLRSKSANYAEHTPGATAMSRLNDSDLKKINVADTYPGYNPFCVGKGDSGVNVCGDMACDAGIQQTCASSSTYPLEVAVTYSGTHDNDLMTITESESRSIIERTPFMDLRNADDSLQTVPLSEHLDNRTDLCGVIKSQHPVQTPWETDAYGVEIKRTLEFVQCKEAYLTSEESSLMSADEIYATVLRGLTLGFCEHTAVCDKDDAACVNDNGGSHLGNLGDNDLALLLQPRTDSDDLQYAALNNIQVYQVPRNVTFEHVTICGATQTKVASEVGKWKGIISRHEEFDVE